MRKGRVRLSYLFQLNKDILAEVTQAKYLGLCITSDLNLEPHISSITSEAHQRLGCVRRNLHDSPHKCRETAYISLVRFQLEYYCTIWDSTLQKHQSALERIQRQAARWTRRQYDLGWQDLVNRRRDQRLILLYKIIDIWPHLQTKWTSRIPNRKAGKAISLSKDPVPITVLHPFGVPPYLGLFPIGTSYLPQLQRPTPLSLLRVG